MVDHSPVRRNEGSSKGLDIDLSCVSAVASHIELHL